MSTAGFERFILHVARWTGFAPDFIQRAPLEAALKRLVSSGASLPQVLERAANDDPGLQKAFSDAISVGETFFFRQPAHFELATAEINDFARSNQPVFRAWSAGCASGEETYSLAASLLAAPLGPDRRIDVLGTDFADKKLFAAREAVYGRWSLRASGPMLFPLLEPGPLGASRVLASVRAVCHFEAHNLLDDPPGEAFDLIFCRNVLVYFAPESSARALAHLASALTPKGLLVLGPMDSTLTPVGLERCGPPELNAFRRARARTAAPRAKSPDAVRPSPPPRPPTASHRRPIEMHLEALGHLDRGRVDLAENLLACLEPNYLPGLLERALLFERLGHRERARTLMQEVLVRVLALPEDALVDGPETLPALYYRSTAGAFVARVEQGRLGR